MAKPADIDSIARLSIALTSLRCHARCEHHDSYSGPIPLGSLTRYTPSPRCPHTATLLADTSERHYRLLCRAHEGTHRIVVAMADSFPTPRHGVVNPPLSPREVGTPTATTPDVRPTT